MTTVESIFTEYVRNRGPTTLDEICEKFSAVHRQNVELRLNNAVRDKMLIASIVDEKVVYEAIPRIVRPVTSRSGRRKAYGR